jgi:lysophospholipase L1-like esterase
MPRCCYWGVSRRRWLKSTARRAGLAAAAILATNLAAGFGGDFALRDGDTVVFLGDSITAAGGYVKTIENYSLLRFPDRRIRFVNSGIGGDTAAGGLARLDRDVFAHGATVLVVAFGINDIGWGTTADDAHKKRFLDALLGIVERCREQSVRIHVCSAAVTAEDPRESQDGFLARMCAEGLEVAREKGAAVIDVQSTMREIQRDVWDANAGVADEAQRASLHVKDGIHLSELGHLAMAYAILRGMDAPQEVSSANIDAEKCVAQDVRGCRIENISGDARSLEFDRHDAGLPINFGLFGGLSFRFVPFPEHINGYRLAVTALPEGSYAVTADGRRLGTFTAAKLAAGVNLASATVDVWQPGGPWDAQCTVLRLLTDSRHEIQQSLKQTAAYLPEWEGLHAHAENVQRLNDQIEAAQRAAARPATYHFVVAPAVAP